MGRSGDVRVGPWGSIGGAYHYEFKPNGKITHIHIRTGGSGGCIDSISFTYVDASTRKECRSPKYGGDGGHLSQEMYIVLEINLLLMNKSQVNYQHIEGGEEIIEMSGTVGRYDGWVVITSLCFKTNKKTTTFGSVCGDKFSLPVKRNTAKFAGFHGRYGGYLDSIGAILEPK